MKIFGCCWDNITLKKDYKGTNCPKNFGFCEDNKTHKIDYKGTNCEEYIYKYFLSKKN